MCAHITGGGYPSQLKAQTEYSNNLQNQVTVVLYIEIKTCLNKTVNHLSFATLPCDFPMMKCLAATFFHH